MKDSKGNEPSEPGDEAPLHKFSPEGTAEAAPQRQEGAGPLIRAQTNAMQFYSFPNSLQNLDEDKLGELHMRLNILLG